MVAFFGPSIGTYIGGFFAVAVSGIAHEHSWSGSFGSPVRSVMADLSYDCGLPFCEQCMPWLSWLIVVG